MLVVRLCFAIGMAAAGAFLAVVLKRVSHEKLCVLISFAAGALLAVVLLDIFPEAIQLGGWLGGSVSIASGYLLFWVITRFVFHVCPACAATHTEANFKAITAAMVVALSVHSFMDGLAIHSAYQVEGGKGLATLLAVAYHKFPEGLALTLVARGSGFSRSRAFFTAFFLEAVTTLTGGIVGFFAVLPGHPHWAAYVLGHVGGGFFFIVVHALLSEVIKHHPRSTILAALAGGLSIVAAGFLN